MNLNQCDRERWKGGRERAWICCEGEEREGATLDSWDSKAVTVKVLR